MTPPIPFFSLQVIHDQLRERLHEALNRVLSSGQFVLGPELERFEEEFAGYCGGRYGTGVANGLDALHLILRGYEIGPGDEVIVPAHTFIATWLAVAATGAKPVPVEPGPDSFTLDPRRLPEAITPKTKAIIAVHLYGYPSDMEAIRRIADRHHLKVLADAAQAHGVACCGNRGMMLGDAAGFSFYPVKNLGALGDGGAIVTNDLRLHQRVRLLRNYGSTSKYEHPIQGVNSRLDELQAAFLREKIPHLESWNRQRREIARRYLEQLPREHLKMPPEEEPNTAVWHQFVVRTPHRGALQEFLHHHGIGTMIHYPRPPHLQGAFAYLGFRRGDFPLTESLHDEVLSLPIWPGLSQSQQDAVIQGIQAFFLNR